MATLSEMLNSIQTQLATLALRLADAECKTTEPGAALSGEDWDDICSSFPAGFGPAWTKNIHSKIDAVLAKRNTAQPTESLADHCAKVAEQVAEMPDWKKGSAVNERTPRQFNSTAQADQHDQHRGTQPAPVDGDLVERAVFAYWGSPWSKNPDGLSDAKKAMERSVNLVQHDSNVRFKNALKESEGFMLTNGEISDILARVVAPPTLQERITERFKTQRCINSSVWIPAELAAIAVEEIAKETK